jgi:cellobiose phosphorylase
MQPLPIRVQIWLSRKTSHGTGAAPLRSELFSIEQLTRHAKSLAEFHQVVTRKGANSLLDRLVQNEGILRDFNQSTLDISAGKRVTPAAEWLLDNFYLIEEQIQIARRHLPHGYSRELPRLLNGSSAGLPRVYDIVHELISHVDAQIDSEPLNAFIAAYQTVASLQLGELWAIPIMLRLGLLENLQQVASRLTLARADSDLATVWMDRLQAMAEKNPSHLVIVVADMAKSDMPLTSSFVAEFSQRLSRQSPALHLARSWLEQRVFEQGSTVEHLVQQESQNQAADRVSVSHAIASLRALSAMDWKVFVESLSQVDEILRTDPADVYSKMDFATRDRYRHSVESISRHSTFAEAEVARMAVQLAAASALETGSHARSAHVGFYLIDKGHSILWRMAQVQWPWRTVIERGIRHFPLTYYAGGIVTTTLLATSLFAWQAEMMALSAWELAVLVLVALLCTSQMAVALLNWLSTLLLRPSLLPRLDLSSGIAPACRTMVVVPTMLASTAGADRLIETLEIHHLANRDQHLHFALLTDFTDATEEIMPGDQALLAHAKAGIESLNQKYPAGKGALFFLLHRPRRWNESEGIWMGYERKRGKLMAFNALLRGGSHACFSEVVGETAILSSIKYVITLDTDTQLPRDAARQLVATMAHPLNHPVFDEKRGIVTTGYSILQPRVGVSLPSARRSWFVRIFASDAGIDPYTREVSDVYQDVFQEGSYIGKGIYDVDAFERAMHGRFPENTILSHDLLEACHARSALVSDVEFFEEYPSRYNVDVDRRRRWIRGDWQITQWLLPRVPGSDANRITNPLSVLSQWKILDNLRRSLVPVALVFLLPGSWLLFPQLGGLGPLLVVIIIAFPGSLAVCSVFRKSADITWPMHLRGAAETVVRQSGQMFLTLAFLPYDAFISMDAIGRTLLRLLVTRKRLLEWRTSSDSALVSRNDLASCYFRMWIGPMTALASASFLAFMQPTLLAAALPVFGLWFVSPLIAWWISRPIEGIPANLSAEQLSFLRVSARKTWHFFDTFVNAEENWLPPDNFQEDPKPVIATRTSPTNIGLSLLANLAARDLGYLSAGRLIQRTQDSFGTMQKLEQYRGHYFNWYDTRTLQPLHPLYVSSVDSGNLAGHLLTLAAGLREQADVPVYSPQLFEGLLDTLKILMGLAGENAALLQLETKLASPPATLREGYVLLERVSILAHKIAISLESRGHEIKQWSQLLQHSCDEHLADLRFIAPWLGDEDFMSATGIPVEQHQRFVHGFTLREISMLANSVPDDTALARCLQDAIEHARLRLQDLESLARQSDELAVMDFSFLFDEERNLFTIGFNVAESRSDASFYDLLASEARLCSYVAIALGQVPQDHWFSMSRLLIASRGEAVLVSWSGSMFEYLMPLLVMPNYEQTLLDHSCRNAVQQQIEYGHARNVPWGISESGYNRVDVQLNYQYRAFGVPGLGLKRGLADDLVIAPYASALALMVAPQQACENLQRLSSEGRKGAYGFYEAVDYTPMRLPPDESSATVFSYMAHHQGISLLAMDNLLQNYPMQRRFMACPLLKAADLLLQERVPKTIASVFSGDLKLEKSQTLVGNSETGMRILRNPASTVPEVHLLSNGNYHVVVSSAGGGYSRWRDLAVTRWREDATRDCWGMFAYLRDVESGEFWSTAYQPTLRKTQEYEAIFTQSRAEFRQQHAGLETHTEISVSPEDDIELRRITITNRTSSPRVIELTSYAEVVLATPAADTAHPAFSNLFVQTEFVQQSSAILCTRRARSHSERPPCLLHMMLGREEEQAAVSCETDRARFVGRGGSMANPAAMQTIDALSNTVGSVLDPIVSLRRTVSLGAHETVIVDLVLGIAENREGALEQVEKYQSARMADRTFDLAWTHSQVTLHMLNATEAEAQLYAKLAGALIYADPARRASPAVLRGNRRGQSGLWSYGISGDAPLVLLRISDTEKIELVRQVIKAHAYWRTKGLTVELVILNEDVSVYRQSLHDTITSLISSGGEAQMLDQPGGIFVRRVEQVSNDDLVLLQSAARIVLDDEKGTLAEQMEPHAVVEPPIPALIPSRSGSAELPAPFAKRELMFENGVGGFTRDGHEYVITLQPGQVTPAPWVNVLTNPYFGTVVSESGAAYTWVENAHEFRLTPWHNDPVQDSAGEAIYIRDEQTGNYWSPTPGPARGRTPYVIRHGFGYSVFEHTENGIASELWVYVAMDAPVKLSVLKLRNVSGHARRISVTGYCEWVLGDSRHKNLLHVQTEVDLKTGALLARNHYNTDYSGRIVFMDVNDATRTLTGDRKEFIGRNGNLTHPAALKRARLSGKFGAGLDPCGAIQVTFDLAIGAARETTFRLGVGRNPTEVHELIRRFRKVDASRITLEGVWEYWNRTLGAVNVDTPDPAVNVMANGWLLYQTLSSRLWGRSGFYQSGGAYGFRDQLQDVMALVHAEPALTREHLLRAATHQFREGDVQHWWHPPAGRGVRTHFSDDYLWLPFVTCRYVKSVADTGVLDETIPFLESRPLKAEEEAFYDLPGRSEEAATLYQHCVRAIERGLNFGEHGLPLMGCGDWNDGMNLVGIKGRGESVWLAFFLYDVLSQFAELARTRNDQDFAERCVTQAQQLKINIERHAWDGNWYRRAWFDDGKMLGSESSPECQIDSLPQSWSVISSAGDVHRSGQAMNAVDQHLVHRDTGLIQLFDPPFDRSALDPGYIKGYIPGVRENGGQYTHGGIWAAMAFALMGDHERAWELVTLLNPVNHSSTPEQIATYKVEPYVIAADVYAVAPHTGRGGWTWYTGSAGWMYRLLIETMLGVNREGDQLRLTPRMPHSWPSYKIHYRYRQTVYHITISQLDARIGDASQLVLDGKKLAANTIPLVDDHQEHFVEMKVSKL